MTAPVLQVKRGALSNLPGLKAGEPAFTTDTFDFFVGIDSTTNNNKFVGSHRYWTKETSTTGSGVRFVERTDGGSNYIEIKAPNTAFAANVTYVLPSTQGASQSVLTNDGSGNLSWASGSNNATFTGITTFSDTTDSTTKDNGAVIIEGGVGIEKSVNIGGNLNVTGLSTFNGLVVGNNGVNVSGFSTIYNLQITNNLNVSGKLDVDNGIDVSNDGVFSGVVSFTNSLQSTTWQNGAVVLDGGLGVGKNVNVHGNLNVDGNVTIGGTFVSIKGQDVYIENKDLILGFTTSITPNDDTANHAGVAIASTEGTPLSSFASSGINTLPDTYKQLMWFKSGTLGFSTDTFAFNYGLAIGTTTMGNGVRLAVGSGITMSDNSISATNGYFTNISAGSVTGTISTATRAQTVDTTSTGTNTNYHLVFTDNATSTTGATMRVDAGIYYNPSSNYLYSSLFVGDVAAAAIKAGDTTTAMTLYSTTGDVAFNGNIRANDGTVALTLSPTTGNVKTGGDLIAGSGYLASPNGTRALYMYDTSGDVSFQGKAVVNQIRSSNNASTLITLNDLDATFARDVKVTGITTTGTLKLAGTSGIGITGISTSVTLAENSNNYLPTQAAVKAYVDAVDVTLGLNADTGGPSTVSTAQTLTISGTANEVETSVSGQTVTVGLPNTVVVGTALSAPTVQATNVKATDGTTAITITNGTGAVGFANSVTISGDLYVIGTTTQVETSELKVQDSLIDLGLIQSGGVLVPPTSDLNIDVGMLMNWYDGSAKKAAVYWDDSAGRIGISSDVSESSGVLTANAYAAVEIGALWVTDCAGTSQVISCTGAERFLNNITVDAGTF